MQRLEGEIFGMDIRLFGALEALDDAVKPVKKAYGFQNIFRQRITRVVRTLKIIEAKVEGRRSPFDDEVARGRRRVLDTSLGAYDEGAAGKLLHGPSAAGEATPQDKIDKLLARFD